MDDVRKIHRLDQEEVILDLNVHFSYQDIHGEDVAVVADDVLSRVQQEEEEPAAVDVVGSDSVLELDET
jgi:hypothetical protein